jgi:hypothetical protein
MSLFNFRSGSRGRRLHHQGPTPTNRPGLKHGISGQGTCRSSISSLLGVERACTAPEPSACSRPRGPSARLQFAPVPPSKDGRSALTLAQSPGRDRHRPPSPHSKCEDSSERQTSSAAETASVAASTCSPGQISEDSGCALRPRRSPAGSHEAPRFSSPSASPAARTPPRLAARCLAMSDQHASMRYQ